VTSLRIKRLQQRRGFAPRSPGGERPAEHSAGLMPMPIRARRCRCGWSSSTAGSCSAYLTAAAPSARCVGDRLRSAKCVTLHPNQGALNLNRLVSVVRDSNRYLSRRVDLSGKSELFRHRQGGRLAARVRLRQSGAQPSCDTGRVSPLMPRACRLFPHHSNQTSGARSWSRAPAKACSARNLPALGARPCLRPGAHRDFATHYPHRPFARPAHQGRLEQHRG